MIANLLEDIGANLDLVAAQKAQIAYVSDQVGGAPLPTDPVPHRSVWRRSSRPTQPRPAAVRCRVQPRQADVQHLPERESC
jgi:hypothetical protein